MWASRADWGWTLETALVTHRRRLGEISLAAAVFFGAAAPDLYSPLFGATVALIGLGALATGVAITRASLLLLALPVMTLATGWGIPWQMGLAVIMSGWWLYTVARLGTLFWFVLIIGALVNAVVVIGSAWSGDYRPDGFFQGPNVTAGVMLVAAIVPLRTHPVPAAILLAAVALTGSRLAVAVALIVIPAMLVTKTASWRDVALTAMLAAMLVIPAWETLFAGLRLTENVWSGTTGILYRLDGAGYSAGLVGQGTAAVDGLHSVPQRLAVEVGLPAAILWGGVSAWALVLRPRLTGTWWVLVVLVLLGTLDYYAFYGDAAPLWWAVVGYARRAHDRSLTGHTGQGGPSGEITS